MNKQKIQLTEWDKIGPTPSEYELDPEKQKLSEWLVNQHLTPADEKRYENIKDKITILDLYKKGIQIQSQQFIGVAEFENFTVSIFPKTSLEQKNLIRLLEYAFDLKHIEIKENELKFEEEDFLRELINIFFVKQCELILKQGLLKRFVTNEGNLRYLRGKLLVQKQILNNMKFNLKFACRFSDLEYDNLENQILLYALRICYKVTKIHHLKKAIRKLIYQLSSVVSDVPVVIYDIDKVTYDRFNKHYEDTHKLGRLILESTGIGDIYSPGKIAQIGKTFFVDMNKVFEKFLERLLIEHLNPPYGEWYVEPHLTRTAWKAERGYDVKIDPDILLRHKDTGEKLIVDAKYKKKISNDDMYQFAFYLSEHDSKRGIAILPTHPEMENNRFTSYKKEIFIDVKRINLNEILELIYSEEDKSEELRNLLNRNLAL